MCKCCITVDGRDIAWQSSIGVQSAATNSDDNEEDGGMENEAQAQAQSSDNAPPMEAEASGAISRPETTPVNATAIPVNATPQSQSQSKQLPQQPAPTPVKRQSDSGICDTNLQGETILKLCFKHVLRINAINQF